MMEPYSMDLSIELIEGSTHNLGDVTLWCRLWANTYNPSQPLPKMLVLHRTPQQWSPPTVIEPTLNPSQVDGVVRALQTLNWPGRQLQVNTVPSELAGWQELRLRVNLNGQSSEHLLVLQYQGISGTDAEGLRVLWVKVMALAGLPEQIL